MDTDILADLQQAIDEVEWKRAGADFFIDDDDPDDPKLEMIIWVEDSDEMADEAAGELKPLTVTRPITGEPGRDQIREMIHWFLCHEADERLWFGNEQPFYPDHPNRQEMGVADAI